MRRELFDGVVTRRHTDRSRTNASPAAQIGRGVADHDDVASRDVQPERFARTSLCDRGKLASRFVVGTVRTDCESIRIDAGSIELRSRAGGEIAGEQTKDDVRALIERVEELGHTRHQTHAFRSRAQLLAQVLDVTVEQPLHSRVYMFISVSLELHQLTNDLRVGLPIEAMVIGAGRPIHLDQGAMNGSFARAGSEENGSVDIEEDQLHIRVNKSPLMMLAAPMHCQTVGVSPSISHATSTAITG